jgi:hypothetical protein
MVMHGEKSWTLANHKASSGGKSWVLAHIGGGTSVGTCKRD